MRILALDWGTVRIGGAISDPDGKIAFPLEKYIEASTAITDIKKLVGEKEVGKILIGLPKSMSGGSNASTAAVEQFVKDIQQQVFCPLEFVDERLSSLSAAKTLTAEGISQKDQRGQLDNLAAQQFLQQYLDSTNKK